MKKFVQFLGLHAHEHSLFIYLAGTKEIHGDFHHSCTCTFAIAVAQGILTMRGGMTSHAAVVARGMGKCCVSGAGEIKIDYKEKTVEMGGKVYNEGDWISLNGSTGEVYDGQVPTTEPELDGDFGSIMNLAAKYTKTLVRTNADSPRDAKQARAFGAQGIGLCRTEHMFFEGDRIKSVREMILASDEEGRRAALAKLLPMQRGDFEGIFEAMDGYGVTSMMARVCISVISGYVMPRRQPRWPSMGLNSSRLSTLALTSAREIPISSASSFWVAVWWGTNSCSGGNGRQGL